MRSSSVVRVGVGGAAALVWVMGLWAQWSWWSQLSGGAVPAWAPVVGVGALVVMTVGALCLESCGLVPKSVVALLAAASVAFGVSLVVEGRRSAVWVSGPPAVVRDARGVWAQVAPPLGECAQRAGVPDGDRWRRAALKVMAVPRPGWWRLLQCQPQQVGSALSALGLRL